MNGLDPIRWPLPDTEPKHEDFERPRVRADCLEGGVNAQRPCPWVSCRYHLAIDISSTGEVKLLFPEKEPWELAQTCVLDAVADGPLTLEQVGNLSNVTRERIRQIETKAFKHTRKAVRLAHPELVPEGVDRPTRDDDSEEELQTATQTPSAFERARAWARRQDEPWTAVALGVHLGVETRQALLLISPLVAAGLVKRLPALTNSGEGTSARFVRSSWEEPRPDSALPVVPELQVALERISQRSTRQAVVRREIDPVPSATAQFVREVEASPERAPDVALYGWDCPDHGAPPQLSPDEGRAPPPVQEEAMSEEKKDAVRKWLGSKKAPQDWFKVGDIAERFPDINRDVLGKVLGALAEEGILVAEGERSLRHYRLADLDAKTDAGEGQEQADEADEASPEPAPERRKPGPKPKVIGAADILAALPQLNVKDLVEIRTQMQAILSSKVAELEQQLAEAKAAIGVAAP